MGSSSSLVGIATAAVLTLALAGGAAAQPQTTVVEGYVFNKWTGIPLEGARVVVGLSPLNAFVPSPTGQFVTDSNGFYSVEVFTDSLGGLAVNCFWATGFASAEVHLPDPPGDFVERNVYLDTPRRRRFSLCTPPSFPLPE